MTVSPTGPLNPSMHCSCILWRRGSGGGQPAPAQHTCRCCSRVGGSAGWERPALRAARAHLTRKSHAFCGEQLPAAAAADDAARPPAAAAAAATAASTSGSSMVPEWPGGSAMGPCVAAARAAARRQRQRDAARRCSWWE